MPSSQIPYKPLVHPNWQFPTQLFTLIDIILAYNPDLKAPWSPTEVTISPLINKLMPMPAYIPISTPTGFFIDLTEKDFSINSLYSEYQSPLPETSKENLFRDSSVKYINLNTEEEEIIISLGDYFILKSLLPNPPSTKWVYIDLIIKDLEVTIYF
jgi:hypothetical protein